MAGKLAGTSSFVVPARRLAVLLALMLFTAVAAPLAGATSAGATSSTCQVNPGQPTSVWGSYDSDQLSAGAQEGGGLVTYATPGNPNMSGGYSTMAAAQDIGAWKFYNNTDYGQSSATARPIDVAMIDTGVSPVPGMGNSADSTSTHLHSLNNLVQGPDFSFEAGTKYAHLDTNGHGTFMASIIAGRDTDIPFDPSLNVTYNGIAPKARIVSVKVADSQGAVDVTQVIAAIDWVAAHAHDHGLNIRVLNMSLGFGPIDGWQSDALSYAVDNAWRKAHIVVVAAAGNAGPGLMRGIGGALNPGYNNEIISVGAYDNGGTSKYDNNAAMVSQGTQSGVGDDSVAPFSSGSNRAITRDPDFIAPGQHLTGYHVVGSQMDTEMYDGCMYPSSTPTTPWTTPVFGPGDRFTRGSGTSEAAAVTSGAVALMLSRYPTLTPDQVKDMLRQTALPLPNVSSNLQGQGELNLAGAFNMAVPNYTQNKSTVGKGGVMDSARGGYNDTTFNTIYHYYLQGFKDTNPTQYPNACENYYANVASNGQFKNTDPTLLNNLNNAYTNGCSMINLQDGADAKGHALYTDVFGNAVNEATLQADEASQGAISATATSVECPSSEQPVGGIMCYYTRAWQTVGSGTSAYEVWMGDTALTEGLGFASDVNGIQTWAGPPATHPWPMFKWGVNQTTKAPQPVTFGITFDPTQAWNNVTQRFSLTSNSWQRFSLTSQDWAGYSLRGNGWQ